MRIPARTAGFFRRVHRRVYYGLLTALERRIYTDPRVTLAAVSKRTAGLLKEYFHREDVCVIPNGVDTNHFSVAARLARRSEARQRRGFRDEDFVLLLIGNDWRNKGLPTILEAMAALPSLPLRLLVVGNDTAESFPCARRATRSAGPLPLGAFESRCARFLRCRGRLRQPEPGRFLRATRGRSHGVRLAGDYFRLRGRR